MAKINAMNHIDATKTGDHNGNIQSFVKNAMRISRYLNRAKIAIQFPTKKGPSLERFMTGLATKSDGRTDELPPRFAPTATNFVSAYTAKFFLRKPSAGSKTTLVKGLQYDDWNTVAAYYEKKYGIKADPTLPLINVGSKLRPEYLLPELCTIVSGQPMKSKLDPLEQDAMIQFACRSPVDNAQSIVAKGRELLQLDGNSLLSSFGLSVDKSLLTVKGRELTPPLVVYNGGRTVTPDNGGWLMKGVRVVKPGKKINNWSFVYPAGADGPLIRKTVIAFVTQCRNTGLDIAANPTGNAVASDFNPDNPAGLTNTFKSLGPRDFVLVVLPRKDVATYNAIKKITDVDLGLVTVCVVHDKLMQVKGQLGYFTNVAVKLNLKVGGVNQSLKNEHPLIKSGKTMVVGYDVTHPTNIAISRDQDGNEVRPPSMVGLVASVDQNLAQWPSESWSNPGGIEILDEKLVEAFKNRLTLWRNKNAGQLPQNIIIYRDGVSEGQFKIVLDQELPHIRRACQAMYGSRQPRITLLVSVKRHQTRFYPTDPNHIHERSKSPKEGTVVDRGVTNVRYWDFFLQAHASLQGKQMRCPVHRITTLTRQQEPLARHITPYCWMRSSERTTRTKQHMLWRV